MKTKNNSETNKFNQRNERNIRGGGLDSFMGKISASVNGKGYPYAKLNSDRSISFFSPDEENEFFNDEENEYRKTELKNNHNNFREIISSSYMTEQLEYYTNEFGFKIIGDKGILETIHHQDSNLFEHKINLSPENLDTILKLNDFYKGYRYGGGILKLTKDFTLKEGSIYTFPVFCFDGENSEKNMMIRADGCQIYEMPTVQLLRLLPDFEKGVDDVGFHWIPEKVEDDLSLGQTDFSKILENIFSKNKISSKEKIRWGIFGSDDGHSNLILIVPDSLNENSPIKICEMDENAKNFYSLYGNVGFEELENCQSLEIDTFSFLNEIKLYHESELKKTLDGDEKIIPESEKERTRAAIKKIDSLIENLQKNLEEEKTKEEETKFENLELKKSEEIKSSKKDEGRFVENDIYDHAPETKISEANIKNLGGKNSKDFCSIS
jgi:hypothetical protein